MVHDAIDTYGNASGSSRGEVGTLDIHVELESAVAQFLNKEAAIIMGMGFATNTTFLPALIGTSPQGILVLSDECNHKSMVQGMRLSGGTVKAFQHNDMDHLEALLEEATVSG